MVGEDGPKVLNYFMKEVEKSNNKRFKMVQSHNKRGYKVAVLAGSFALFSYFYTMYTIRRDRYLDRSFDELPEADSQK